MESHLHGPVGSGAPAPAAAGPVHTLWYLTPQEVTRRVVGDGAQERAATAKGQRARRNGRSAKVKTPPTRSQIRPIGQSVPLNQVVVLYPLQLLGRVQLQRVAAHPRVPQVAAAGGGCTCQTDQCTAIAHKCALVLSLHVCRAFVPVQLVRKARLRAALPAFCGASLVHQPASSHAWLSLPAHTSWPAMFNR